MTFRITFSSCQKPDGNQPISKVLDIGSRAHYFIGDYYYNDAGGSVTLNGVTHVPTVYGPTGNNTYARNLARFVNVYGRQGLATYQELWNARDAGRIKVYLMRDDHDGAWNNNDHSLAVFKDAYNVAAGTLSGQTDGSLTQADVLAQWRLGEQVLLAIQKEYADNPYGPPNGDIPSAMVGTAQASDYLIAYFYTDYAVDGTEGGRSHRVIVPDCNRFKDPAANTDNASKTMLGKAQMAWLKAAIVEAADLDFNHIVILWTKDLLNKDNGDGGAGYRTEIDALMTWAHANDYPVISGSGDRHSPHSGTARVSNGDAYDAIVVCACPFGQGCGNLTQYAENEWGWAVNDACVVGVVEVDEVAKTTSLIIADAFSMEPLYVATIPFGKRLPSNVQSVQAKDFRPSPAPYRIAPSVPASLAVYVNAQPTPVQVVISGGTVSAIEVTRDQSTYDLTGLTAGAFVLAPGDGIRMTHTVAPTKFAVYPLA